MGEIVIKYKNVRHEPLDMFDPESAPFRADADGSTCVFANQETGTCTNDATHITVGKYTATYPDMTANTNRLHHPTCDDCRHSVGTYTRYIDAGGRA